MCQLMMVMVCAPQTVSAYNLVGVTFVRFLAVRKPLHVKEVCTYVGQCHMHTCSYRSTCTQTGNIGNPTARQTLAAPSKNHVCRAAVLGVVILYFASFCFQILNHNRYFLGSAIAVNWVFGYLSAIALYVKDEEPGK